MIFQKEDLKCSNFKHEKRLIFKKPVFIFTFNLNINICRPRNDLQPSASIDVNIPLDYTFLNNEK